MLCFSAAFSGSQPIPAVREVKVVDIGVNFFTLSWRKTKGASGYKISWIPFLGKGTIAVCIIAPYSQLLIDHWTFTCNFAHRGIVHHVYSSFSPGGDEKSQVVSAASTTYTIGKLRESSAYKIQVSSVVGNREGSPLLLTARTCESCLPETARKSLRWALHQRIEGDIYPTIIM